MQARDPWATNPDLRLTRGRVKASGGKIVGR
jgi:hypothetical protein